MSKPYCFFKNIVRDGSEDNTVLTIWKFLDSWIFQNDWISIFFIIFLGITFEIILIKICASFKKPVLPEKGGSDSNENEDSCLESIEFALEYQSVTHLFSEERVWLGAGIPVRTRAPHSSTVGYPVDQESVQETSQGVHIFSERITSILPSEENEGNFEDLILSSDEKICSDTSESDYQVSHFCKSYIQSSGGTSSSLSLFCSEVKETFPNHRQHTESEYEEIHFSSKKLFSILKTNKNKMTEFSSDLSFPKTSKFTIENEYLNVAPCPPAHLFLSRDQVRLLEENVRNQIPLKPKVMLESETNYLYPRPQKSLTQNRHSDDMVISAQTEDSLPGQNAIQNQGFYEVQFTGQTQQFIHSQESVNSQLDNKTNYLAQPQDLMGKPFSSCTQDSFQAQDIDRIQHFIKDPYIVKTQDSIKGLKSDEHLGKAQYSVCFEDLNKIKYSIKGQNSIFKNAEFLALTLSPNAVAEDTPQLKRTMQKDQQNIASSELNQHSLYCSMPLSPTIKMQKNKRKTPDCEYKLGLRIPSLKAKKAPASQVFQIIICHTLKNRKKLGCKNNTEKTELQNKILHLISVSKLITPYIKKHSRKNLVKVMSGLIKCRYFLQKQNKSQHAEKINYAGFEKGLSGIIKNVKQYDTESIRLKGTSSKMLLQLEQSSVVNTDELKAPHSSLEINQKSKESKDPIKQILDLHIPKHEIPSEEGISKPKQKFVSFPKMKSNAGMKINEDLQSTENGEELPTRTPNMQSCFPKENIQKQKDVLEIVMELSDVNLVISLESKIHNSSEELEDTEMQGSTENADVKKKKPLIPNITEPGDLSESEELECNTRSNVKNMHQDKSTSDAFHNATYTIISKPSDTEIHSSWKIKTGTSKKTRLSFSVLKQEKLPDEKNIQKAKHINKNSLFKKPQECDREENEQVILQLRQDFKIGVYIKQKPKYVKFKMEQICSGSRETQNKDQGVYPQTFSTQTALRTSPCPMTDPLQVEKVKKNTYRPTGRESAIDSINPFTMPENLPVGEYLIEITEDGIPFGRKPSKTLDSHIAEEKKDLKGDLPVVAMGSFEIRKKLPGRKNELNAKNVIMKVKKPALSLMLYINRHDNSSCRKKLGDNFEIIIKQMLQDKILSNVPLKVYPHLSILPNTRMHIRLNAGKCRYLKLTQEKSQVEREQIYLDSFNKENESQNTLEARLQDEARMVEKALPKAGPHYNCNFRFGIHPVNEIKTEKEMHRPISFTEITKESIASSRMDPSHIANVKRSISTQTDFWCTPDLEMPSLILGKSLLRDPLNQIRQSNVPNSGGDSRETGYARKKEELTKDLSATSPKTFNCCMPDLSCSKKKKKRVKFINTNTVNMKMKPSVSQTFSITGLRKKSELNFKKIGQAEGLVTDCLNTLYSPLHSRLQRVFCHAQLEQEEPTSKKYIDFLAKSRAFYVTEEKLQDEEKEKQKALLEASPQHGQHVWSDSCQVREIHLDESDLSLIYLTQEQPVNGHGRQHQTDFLQTTLEGSLKMDPMHPEELQKTNKTENNIEVLEAPKILPSKARSSLELMNTTTEYSLPSGGNPKRELESYLKGKNSKVPTDLQVTFLQSSDSIIMPSVFKPKRQRKVVRSAKKRHRVSYRHRTMKETKPSISHKQNGSDSKKLHSNVKVKDPQQRTNEIDTFLDLILSKVPILPNTKMRRALNLDIQKIRIDHNQLMQEISPHARNVHCPYSTDVNSFSNVMKCGKNRKEKPIALKMPGNSYGFVFDAYQKKDHDLVKSDEELTLSGSTHTEGQPQTDFIQTLWGSISCPILDQFQLENLESCYRFSPLQPGEEIVDAFSTRESGVPPDASHHKDQVGSGENKRTMTLGFCTSALSTSERKKNFKQFSDTKISVNPKCRIKKAKKPSISYILNIKGGTKPNHRKKMVCDLTKMKDKKVADKMYSSTMYTSDIKINSNIETEEGTPKEKRLSSTQVKQEIVPCDGNITSDDIKESNLQDEEEEEEESEEALLKVIPPYRQHLVFCSGQRNDLNFYKSGNQRSRKILFVSEQEVPLQIQPADVVQEELLKKSLQAQNGTIYTSSKLAPLKSKKPQMDEILIGTTECDVLPDENHTGVPYSWEEAEKAELKNDLQATILEFLNVSKPNLPKSNKQKKIFICKALKSKMSPTCIIMKARKPSVSKILNIPQCRQKSLPPKTLKSQMVKIFTYSGVLFDGLYTIVLQDPIAKKQKGLAQELPAVILDSLDFSTLPLPASKRERGNLELRDKGHKMSLKCGTLKAKKAPISQTFSIIRCGMPSLRRQLKCNSKTKTKQGKPVADIFLNVISFPMPVSLEMKTYQIGNRTEETGMPWGTKFDYELQQREQSARGERARHAHPIDKSTTSNDTENVKGQGREEGPFTVQNFNSNAHQMKEAKFVKSGLKLKNSATHPELEKSRRDREAQKANLNNIQNSPNNAMKMNMQQEKIEKTIPRTFSKLSQESVPHYSPHFSFCAQQMKNLNPCKSESNLKNSKGRRTWNLPCTAQETYLRKTILEPVLRQLVNFLQVETVGKLPQIQEIIKSNVALETQFPKPKESEIGSIPCDMPGDGNPRRKWNGPISEKRALNQKDPRIALKPLTFSSLVSPESKSESYTIEFISKKTLSPKHVTLKAKQPPISKLLDIASYPTGNRKKKKQHNVKYQMGEMQRHVRVGEALLSTIEGAKSPLPKLMIDEQPFDTARGTPSNRTHQKTLGGHMTKEKGELQENLATTFLGSSDIFMPVLPDAKSQVNIVQLSENEIILNHKCLTVKEKKPLISQILKINGHFTTKHRKKFASNLRTKMKVMWQVKNMTDTFLNTIYFTSVISDIKKQNKYKIEIGLSSTEKSHIHAELSEPTGDGISNKYTKKINHSAVKEKSPYHLAGIIDPVGRQLPTSEEIKNQINSIKIHDMSSAKCILSQGKQSVSQSLNAVGYASASINEKWNSKSPKIKTVKHKPVLNADIISAHTSMPLLQCIKMEHSPSTWNTYEEFAEKRNTLSKAKVREEEYKQQVLFRTDSGNTQPFEFGAEQMRVTGPFKSEAPLINTACPKNITPQKTGIYLIDQDAEIKVGEEVSSESSFFSEINPLQNEKQKKEFKTARWRTRTNSKTLALQKKQPESYFSDTICSSPCAYLSMYPKIIRHKDMARTADVKSPVHTKQVRLDAKKTPVSQWLECGTQRNKKELRCNIIKQNKELQQGPGKNVAGLVLSNICDSGCITSLIKEVIVVKREKDKLQKPIHIFPQLKLKKSLIPKTLYSQSIDQSAISSVIRRPEKCVIEQNKEHQVVLLDILPQCRDHLMINHQMEKLDHVKSKVDSEGEAYRVAFPQKTEINFSMLNTPRIRTYAESEFLVAQRVKQGIIDIAKRSVSILQGTEESKEKDISSSKGENIFLTELDAFQQKTHKKRKLLRQEGNSITHCKSVMPIRGPLHLENTGQAAKEGNVYINPKSISDLLGRGLKKTDILLGSKGQKFFHTNLGGLHKTCAAPRGYAKPVNSPSSIPDSIPCHIRDPFHLKQAVSTARKESDSISVNVNVDPWRKRQSELSNSPLISNRKKMNFSTKLRSKQLNICNQNKKYIMECIFSCILHQIHIENSKKQFSAKAVLSSKVLNPMVKKASNEVSIPVDQPPCTKRVNLHIRGKKEHQQESICKTSPTCITHSLMDICQITSPWIKKALKAVDDPWYHTTNTEKVEQKEKCTYMPLPKPTSHSKTDTLQINIPMQQVKLDALKVLRHDYSTSHTKIPLKQMDAIDGYTQKRKKERKEHHLPISYDNIKEHLSYSQNYPYLPPHLMPQTKAALSEISNVSSRIKGLHLFSKDQISMEWFMPSITPIQMKKQNRTLHVEAFGKSTKYQNLLFSKGNQSSHGAQVFESLSQGNSLRLRIRNKVELYKAKQKRQIEACQPTTLFHSFSVFVHLLHENKRQKGSKKQAVMKGETCPQRGTLKWKKAVFSDPFHVTDCDTPNKPELQWNIKETMPSMKHRSGGPDSVVTKVYEPIPCLPHIRLDKETTDGTILDSVKRTKQHISQEEKDSVKTVAMKEIMDFRITLKREKSSRSHTINGKKLPLPLGIRKNKVQERKGKSGIKLTNLCTSLSSPLHPNLDSTIKVENGKSRIPRSCLPPLKLQASSNIRKIFSESANTGHLSKMIELKCLPQRKKEYRENRVDVNDIMDLICTILKGKNSPFKQLLHGKEPRKKRKREKMMQNKLWDFIPSSSNLEWDPKIKECYIQGVRKFCLPTSTLQELSGAMEMCEEPTDDILSSIKRAKHLSQKDRVEITYEEIMQSERITLGVKQSSELQELQLNDEEKEKKVQEDKPDEIQSKSSISLPPYTEVDSTITEVTRYSLPELSHQKSSDVVREASKESIESNTTSDTQKVKEHMPQKREDRIKILAKKDIVHSKDKVLEGNKAHSQDQPLNPKEQRKMVSQSEKQEKTYGESEELGKRDYDGKDQETVDGESNEQRKVDREGKEQEKVDLDHKEQRKWDQRNKDHGKVGLEDPGQRKTDGEGKEQEKSDSKKQRKVDLESKEQEKTDLDNKKQGKWDQGNKEQGKMNAEDQNQRKTDKEGKEQAKLDYNGKDYGKMDPEGQKQKKTDPEGKKQGKEDGDVKGQGKMGLQAQEQEKTDEGKKHEKWDKEDEEQGKMAQESKQQGEIDVQGQEQEKTNGECKDQEEWDPDGEQGEVDQDSKEQRKMDLDIQEQRKTNGARKEQEECGQDSEQQEEIDQDSKEQEKIYLEGQEQGKTNGKCEEQEEWDPDGEEEGEMDPEGQDQGKTDPEGKEPEKAGTEGKKQGKTDQEGKKEEDIVLYIYFPFESSQTLHELDREIEGEEDIPGKTKSAISQLQYQKSFGAGKIAYIKSIGEDKTNDIKMVQEHQPQKGVGRGKEVNMKYIMYPESGASKSSQLPLSPVSSITEYSGPQTKEEQTNVHENLGQVKETKSELDEVLTLPLFHSKLDKGIKIKEEKQVVTRSFLPPSQNIESSDTEKLKHTVLSLNDISTNSKTTKYMTHVEENKPNIFEKTIMHPKCIAVRADKSHLTHIIKEKELQVNTKEQKKERKGGSEETVLLLSKTCPFVTSSALSKLDTLKEEEEKEEPGIIKSCVLHPVLQEDLLAKKTASMESIASHVKKRKYLPLTEDRVQTLTTNDLIHPNSPVFQERTSSPPSTFNINEYSTLSKRKEPQWNNEEKEEQKEEKTTDPNVVLTKTDPSMPSPSQHGFSPFQVKLLVSSSAEEIRYARSNRGVSSHNIIAKANLQRPYEEAEGIVKIEDTKRIFPERITLRTEISPPAHLHKRIILPLSIKEKREKMQEDKSETGMVLKKTASLPSPFCLKQDNRVNEKEGTLGRTQFCSTILTIQNVPELDKKRYTDSLESRDNNRKELIQSITMEEEKDRYKVDRKFKKIPKCMDLKMRKLSLSHKLSTKELQRKIQEQKRKMKEDKNELITVLAHGIKKLSLTQFQQEEKVQEDKSEPGLVLTNIHTARSSPTFLNTNAGIKEESRITSTRSSFFMVNFQETLDYEGGTYMKPDTSDILINLQNGKHVPGNKEENEAQIGKITMFPKQQKIKGQEYKDKPGVVLTKSSTSLPSLPHIISGKKIELDDEMLRLTKSSLQRISNGGEAVPTEAIKGDIMKDAELQHMLQKEETDFKETISRRGTDIILKARKSPPSYKLHRTELHLDVKRHKAKEHEGQGETQSIELRKTYVSKPIPPHFKQDESVQLDKERIGSKISFLPLTLPALSEAEKRAAIEAMNGDVRKGKQFMTQKKEGSKMKTVDLTIKVYCKKARISLIPHILNTKGFMLNMKVQEKKVHKDKGEPCVFLTKNFLSIPLAPPFCLDSGDKVDEDTAENRGASCSQENLQESSDAEETANRESVQSANKNVKGTEHHVLQKEAEQQWTSDFMMSVQQRNEPPQVKSERDSDSQDENIYFTELSTIRSWKMIELPLIGQQDKPKEYKDSKTSTARSPTESMSTLTSSSFSMGSFHESSNYEGGTYMKPVTGNILINLQNGKENRKEPLATFHSFPTMNSIKIGNLKKQSEIMNNLNHKISPKASISLPRKTSKEIYITCGTPLRSKGFSATETDTSKQEASSKVSPESVVLSELHKPEKNVESNNKVSKMFSPEGLESLEEINITNSSTLQNTEEKHTMKKQVMAQSKFGHKTMPKSTLSLKLPLQNRKQETLLETDTDKKATVYRSLQILTGEHMDVTACNAQRGKEDPASLIPEQEKRALELLQKFLKPPWTLFQSGHPEEKDEANTSTTINLEQKKLEMGNNSAVGQEEGKFKVDTNTTVHLEEDKTEMHENTVNLEKENIMDTRRIVSLGVLAPGAEKSQVITHTENNCPVKQKQEQELELSSFAEQNIQVQKLSQRNVLDSFHALIPLSLKDQKGLLTITSLKRELNPKYVTMKIQKHPVSQILGITGHGTPSKRIKLEFVDKKPIYMVSCSENIPGMFIRSLSISMSLPHTEETVESETNLVREKKDCLSEFQEKSPNTSEIIKKDTLIRKREQNLTNTVPQDSQPFVSEQQMQKLPHVKSEANLKGEINKKKLTPQTREKLVPGYNDFRIIKKPDMHMTKQEEKMAECILTPIDCPFLFDDPMGIVETHMKRTISVNIPSPVVEEPQCKTQLFDTGEYSLLPKQRNQDDSICNTTTQKVQQQEIVPRTILTPPQVKNDEFKIPGDGTSAESLFLIYEAIKSVFKFQVGNMTQDKVFSDKSGKVQAYKPDELKSSPFPEDLDISPTTYSRLQHKHLLKHFTAEEKNKLTNHLHSKALEIKLNLIPEMAKISLRKFIFYSKGDSSEDNSWKLYPRHKKVDFMSSEGVGTVEFNLKHNYQKDCPPLSSMKTWSPNVSSSKKVIPMLKNIKMRDSQTSLVTSASEIPLTHVLQSYSVKEKDKLFMHLSIKTLEIQMKAFSKIVRDSCAMASASDRMKPSLNNCMHTVVQVPKQKSKILLFFEEKSLHEIDLDLQYKHLRFHLGLSVDSTFPKPKALPKHTLKLNTVSACKKIDDSGEGFTPSLDTELLEQRISFKKQSPHENSLLFRKFLEPISVHDFDHNLCSVGQKDTRVLSEIKSHQTPEEDKQCHVQFQETKTYNTSDLRTWENTTDLLDSHSTQISDDSTNIQINTESSANLEEYPTLESDGSEESMFFEASPFLSQVSQNVLFELQKGIPLKKIYKIKEATYLKPFYSSCDSHRSRKYKSSSNMLSPEWVCVSSSNTVEIQSISSSISFSEEKLSWTSTSTSYSSTSSTESNIKLQYGKKNSKPHMHSESKERKKAKFEFRKRSVHWDCDYSHEPSKEKHPRKEKGDRSDCSQNKHRSASKLHREGINFHSEGKQNQPFFYACRPADSLEILPQTIRFTVPPKTLKKRNFKVPLVAKISGSWNIWNSSKKLLGSLSGPVSPVHQS